MCGAVPCSAVSSSIFPLHWKLWLLLAIFIICLSSLPTVKHDSLNLHHITPLLSSPVCKMKAFLFRQTSASPFCAGPRVWVAAFSSCVCCIFWFIYTHLVVAPRACQVETLHVHYAGWVKFLFEIYMNAGIYLLLRSPCASWRVPFPIVALVWNVAWSLKAPHMRPPNRTA